MKTARPIGVAMIVIVAACWMLAAGANGQATGPAAKPSSRPAAKPASGPAAKPASGPAAVCNFAHIKAIDAAREELTLDLGNKVTMKLVLIPAGKFTMGSTKDVKVGFGLEDGPPHEVTISRPFHMGVYHVTRGQFAAFIADSGYKTDAETEGWSNAVNAAKVNGASWKKPGFDQTDEHPVVCVSHNDAVAFCDWLAKKSGKTVKLPTEAQWEYACRGGTKTAYPWGDDPDGGKGWANCADQAAKKTFADKLGYFAWDDGYTYTSPGGKFKANAFGLYDMLGNAFQWCADWYDGKYYSADANNVDPQGPPAGTRRTLRGGGWASGPRTCRSAGRGGSEPVNRYNFYGFRVVVEAK